MDKTFLSQKQAIRQSFHLATRGYNSLGVPFLPCACRSSEGTVADSEFLQTLKVEISISEFKYKHLTIGFKQKSSSFFARKIAVEPRDKVNSFFFDIRIHCR